VDALQGAVGQILLVVVALAVVLFTLILLLVEADYILRLCGKLARRWKSYRLDPDGSAPSAIEDRTAERPRDKQAVR
jgi:hypothetical protein